MPYWGMRSGIQGRDTVANDTPGAIRYSEYYTSAGVNTREPQAWMRVFNNTGGAMVIGATYKLDYGAVGKNPQIVATATTTPNAHVVVATDTAANQTWTWVVIWGFVDALVEGTTAVTAADFLKITVGTSTTGFIKDGTAKTTKSGAIALAGQATAAAVATKVFLLGEICKMD